MSFIRSPDRNKHRKKKKIYRSLFYPLFLGPSGPKLHHRRELAKRLVRERNPSVVISLDFETHGYNDPLLYDI